MIHPTSVINSAEEVQKLSNYIAIMHKRGCLRERYHF